MQIDHDRVGFARCLAFAGALQTQGTRRIFNASSIYRRSVALVAAVILIAITVVAI